MQKGNLGKKFEEDIKQSFEKDNIYCLRLKDSSSSYANNSKSRFTSTNPCDFIGFNTYNNKILYIECKSTQDKSLSFNNLKEHQLKEMIEIEEKFEYINSYCFINFRKTENTYCIKTKYIYDFYYSLNNRNKEGRKSIPEKFVQENGVKIKSRKKITRFDYYIDELFNILQQG